jgi:hypothetical protein
MSQVGSWVVTVVLVAVLAMVSRLGSDTLVVVGGALLLVDLCGLRLATGRRRATTGPSGALAACWLAAALFPVHNFSRRANSEAVTSLGLQPVVELLLFGAIGAYALHSLRRVEPTLRAARPPLAVLALPIWVGLSAMWSDTGSYAFARGAQMLALGLLAWATIAVARTDAAALESTLRFLVEGFLAATFVLMGLGVLLGPLYVPTSSENLGRFTWIGAHPNGAGLVMAVAAILLVTARRHLLRLPLPVRVGGCGVLAVALHANHSRAALACLVLALGFAAVVTARRRPVFRTVGLPLLVTAGVGVLLRFAGEAWSYVLRGRDADSLADGNGRLRLWRIGIDSLDGPFEWFAGSGYGTARTLFSREISWALTAHNSVLSLLVSVGLVGVLALVVLVVGAARDLVRSRRSPADQLMLASVLILVLANGVATDVLAEPNIGFAVVALVAAYGRVARCASESDGAEHPLAPVTGRNRAEPPRQVVGLALPHLTDGLGEEGSQRRGMPEVVDASGTEEPFHREHDVTRVGGRVEADHPEWQWGGEQIDEDRGHIRQ